MLGFEIFVHSVKMVLRNLQQAIQISLVPALIGAALVFALFLMFDIPLEEFDSEVTGYPEGVTGGSFFGFFICLFAVVLSIMFWIVVSWHRFILLEEYPSGFLPRFRSDRILAYFGRVLLLGILAVIIGAPVLFIIGAIMQVSGVFGLILMLCFVICMSVAFYRLALILPGAAIGKSLTLTEVWRATEKSNGAILVLIITSFLFQLLLQIVFSLVAFIPVIGVVAVLVVSMLVVPLINVSILTTLYGVFIERRELR